MQSYNEPNSDEEDLRLQSELVSSVHEVTEAEKVQSGEGLNGEEKEDLPLQPPPVEEKPKEGENIARIFC